MFQCNFIYSDTFVNLRIYSALLESNSFFFGDLNVTVKEGGES